MRQSIKALALFSFLNSVAPSQTFQIASDLLDGRLTSKWRGAIISPSLSDRANEPILRVIDSDGHSRDIRIDVAGAIRLTLSDALVLNDGAIVAAASAWSQSAQVSSIIVFINADGTIRLIRQMNPFHVYRIALAPGGLLWTFGQPIADGFQGLEQDHAVFQVLRILDGSTLASHTQASSVSRLRKIPVASSALTEGHSALFAGDNHVGLYLASPRQWLEYGGDGTLLGKWILETPVVSRDGRSKALNLTGMGFTGSGRLVAYFRDHSDWKTAGYYELDRAAGAWRLLPEIDATQYGMLLGTQGNKILVLDLPPESAVRKYRWVEVR